MPPLGVELQEYASSAGRRESALIEFAHRYQFFNSLFYILVMVTTISHKRTRSNEQASMGDPPSASDCSFGASAHPTCVHGKNGFSLNWSQRKECRDEVADYEQAARPERGHYHVCHPWHELHYLIVVLREVLHREPRLGNSEERD